MSTFLWQPTVWLGDLSGAGPNLIDESVGIVQPEEQWLHTGGYNNVVLAVFNYAGLTDTLLYLEGTDTPAGGWVTVASLSTADVQAELVSLTRVRQRSNSSGRLWDYLRWRWGPRPGIGPGGLNGETVCFKIQAVMKP